MTEGVFYEIAGLPQRQKSCHDCPHRLDNSKWITDGSIRPDKLVRDMLHNFDGGNHRCHNAEESVCAGAIMFKNKTKLQLEQMAQEVTLSAMRRNLR